MSKKLYYRDENGNKKYYVGKVINDYITNETYGLLTKEKIVEEQVKLYYHKPIDAIEGWCSYFTYINENNEVVKYTDNINNIRKNIDNSYYFTKVNKNIIDLIHHPEIKSIEPYFSYIDENGKEQIYDGKSFYDKFTNSYYFYK